MSTSASFRAFIPALTFFFAIARARRRIRAARGVVVVADSRATRDGPPRDGSRASIDDVDSKRSTTRRSIRKSIDDASIYFSTTRASIDRPTDRPRAAAPERDRGARGHVLRDQWGGAGAPGGDAERRAVREIVDREGDRGARANRGRGEGDGRTRAGDRGERGADAT